MFARVVVSRMSTFKPRQNRQRRYPCLNNISMAGSFSSKMVNTLFQLLLCHLTGLLGRDFTGRPGTEGQEPPQMLKAPLTGLTKTAKKILSTQKHPECTSLFIGNLGFVATEDSLINLFARHMKPTHDSKVLLDKEKWLHKVRMGTFEDSGKCKGLVDRSNRAPTILPIPPAVQIAGPLSTLRGPSTRPWLSPTRETIPSTGARWSWSTLLQMQSGAVVSAILVSAAQTKNRARQRQRDLTADRQKPNA